MYRIGFYLKAIQGADSEGMIWTPMLDALALRGDWPDAGTLEAECDEPFISEHDRIAQLLPWVRGVSSAGEAAALLEFRAPAVRALAVREVVPDDNFISEVLGQAEEGDPGIASHLAENPNLNDAQRRHLTEEACGLLYGGSSAQSAVALSILSKIKSSPPIDISRALCRSIQEARKDRIPLPLLRGLRPLLAREDLDAEALAELAQVAADGYTALACHPSAGIEVWQELLRRGRREPAAWWALTESDRALSHPEVRARLLKLDKSPRTARLLLERSASDEFKEVFSVLCELVPQWAIRELETGLDSNPGFAGISTTYLLPLLQCEDREVRMRAMILIPRIAREDSVRADPEVRRSDSPESGPQAPTR
jgi:hypothetical protein